ncbi:arginase [Rhizobiales bacterium GAS191]|jgi:arginase|nr:arginase [Rhizobiales bacterium GAS113]SEE57407.1 arginase [Rhizobiales bacterium GAS191]
MSSATLTGTIAGRAIALIEAPSNLGLMPPAPGKEPGTRRAPDALRRAGLHEALRPASVTRIEAAPYDPDEANAGSVRNLEAIADYAVRLADAVGRARSAGLFPLLIGGDCSILLGAMLGLRRSGEYGLVFIDGHTDFYLPEQSSTGGAAGLDLALVTGWGPPALTDLEGLRPYVRPEHVVAIGNRDHALRRRAAIPAPADALGASIDLAAARQAPIDDVLRRGLATTGLAALDGIFAHCDVDVLDNEVMPAVDSPQPGGLSYDELATLFAAVRATGKFAGLEITIFDPDLDPDGAIAERLVRELARAVLD